MVLEAKLGYGRNGGDEEHSRHCCCWYVASLPVTALVAACVVEPRSLLSRGARTFAAS
jgi:hypothetical protein